MIKNDSNTNSLDSPLSPPARLHPKISIVVSTYRRLKFLLPMLDSLSAAIRRANLDSVETLLCINGSDPETFSASQALLQKANLGLSITYLEEKRTPAEARNTVSQKAIGEWILFLDDDILVPPDFLRNFLQLQSAHQQVNVWGGPNLTPPNSSATEKNLGWFLENFWITGPISFRYKLGVNRQKSDFIFHFSLCNLFVRRHVFHQLHFKNHLLTAEENELLFQIQKLNMKTEASELLFIWHFRRENRERFLLQIKNYGFGRGQLIAHRCFKWDSLIVAILAIASALLTLISFTKAAFSLFVLWWGFLSVQQWLLFRQKDWRYYILPLAIWVQYAFGIFLGLQSQLRIRSVGVPAIQNK